LMLKQPDTYSVPAAGRRLGLGRNASYQAARRGQLPILRFGRKLRVPRLAFEKMLAEAGSKGRSRTARKRLTESPQVGRRRNSH
jgi:excisionase family DNA binding protein